MPGQIRVVVATEHTRHHACTARQPGTRGDLAVAGDPSGRNGADDVKNAQPHLLA
ncbi:hypothetical protein XVE_3145 [Xanthomonas vesicatoria ATCC 35937]|uniref:Uncharacterized protein n=1 Tax=Xanthomonas vesicatoria ATCC 35937 TaxID=925775 RepID=F0BFY0_9XANT|nr:hypothetical protein XVE_3145 [Xanthomonas vesicatoria ATCC 35937]